MFSGAKVMWSWIDTWDTSNLKDMSHMFSNAVKFTSHLNFWDISKVEDMSYTFYSKLIADSLGIDLSLHLK